MGDTRQWCEVADVSATTRPGTATARCHDGFRSGARRAGVVCRLAALVLVMSLAPLGGGCGPGHSIHSRDPDADGNAADGGDDSDVVAGLAVEGGSDRGDQTRIPGPTCETARTICVGPDVRACVDNRPGDLLEVCPSSCHLGRCTTPACVDAESTQGLHGCRFYGVQSDNIDSDDDRKTMVLLSNAGPEEVQARLEVRGADGTWASLQTTSVPASGGARMQVEQPVLGMGVTPAGAFRVETDGPVLAVQIISDDSDRTSRSSAGTALRPVQALGRGYVAVTLPALDSAAVAMTSGSRGGAGVITVIATAPDTHLKVELKEIAVMRMTGRYGGPLAVPLASEVTLMDEGDVLQIFSTLPEGDLTGTIIASDMPVALFSGNVFTTYGYPLSGFNGGDLAQEQMPPTASWGNEYVGARLSPQPNCDPFFGTAVGLWRVIAAQDNTTVRIFPAASVSVDWPDLAAPLEFTLAEGGYQAFWTRGNLKVMSPADVLVRADKPILLAQWLDCEPGLSWGIDTRLSGRTLGFTLPPRFDHELVVVKKAGEPLLLDDRLIAPERFTAASSDRKYEVVRLGSADLAPCSDLVDRCDHRLSGPAFGVSWRGMDVVCSYALTVPSGHICALPNAGCPP